MIEIKENTRLIWPDNCKAIAMIGVYLVHFGPNPLLFNWIWFIMLPIFFYISGYFFKYRSLKSSLLKLFAGLILPYLCVSLIVRLCSIRFIAKVLDGDWLYVLENLSRIFIDLNQYWFITCLVTIQLCIIVLFSVVKNDRLRYGFFLCLEFLCLIYPLMSQGIVLPFCFSPSIMGLGFFIMGFFRKEYEKYLDKIPTAFIMLLFIVYIGVGLYITYIYDAFVDVHLNLYKPLWITWFLSLIGTVIFIECIKRINIKNRILSFVGQNTLVLFLYCGFTTHFLTLLLPLNFNLTTNGIIYTVLLLSINLLIAYLTNRFFPIMSGKKRFR